MGIEGHCVIAIEDINLSVMNLFIDSYSGHDECRVCDLHPIIMHCRLGADSGVVRWVCSNPPS